MHARVDFIERHLFGDGDCDCHPFILTPQTLPSRGRVCFAVSTPLVARRFQFVLNGVETRDAGPWLYGRLLILPRKEQPDDGLLIVWVFGVFVPPV